MHEKEFDAFELKMKNEEIDFADKTFIFKNLTNGKKTFLGLVPSFK